MDCFDYLLESYNEDKFDLGYKACLADMFVYAEKLAKKNRKEANKQGVLGKGTERRTHFLSYRKTNGEDNSDFFDKLINKNGTK